MLNYLIFKLQFLKFNSKKIINEIFYLLMKKNLLVNLQNIPN